MSFTLGLDFIVMAESDAAVIAGCHDLRRALTEGNMGVETNATPSACEHHPSLVVTTHHKRRLVQRLAASDGPLACHAIRGCLHHCISCLASESYGGHANGLEELQAWLRLVIETIEDCLEQVRNVEGTGGRLRCATSLMQLCSTILKDHRGSSSHSERDTRSMTAQTSGVAPRAIFRAGDSNIIDAWRARAAHECARLAASHLCGMIRASSVPTLGRTGERFGVYCGDDALFWTLSLVSDVLKHQHVSRRDCSMPDMLNQGNSEETKAQSATIASTSPEGSLLGCLDIAALAEVLSNMSLEFISNSVDVTLKWLEVTQLLMDVSEATSTNEVFSQLSRSVPQTLWAISGGKGSLLPIGEDQDGVQSPGVAFVEEWGTNGALSQAMISTVFRMLRCRGELKWENDSDIMESDNSGDVSHAEKSKAGRRRPWGSAVDALVDTAAAVRPSEERRSRGGLAARLTRVFGDQDDALMDMLLANLHVFHSIHSQGPTYCTLRSKADNERKQSVSSSLAGLYRDDLHPAILFAALLTEVRFDSGVLLDWIISPETCFLRYITVLLRLAASEWPEFAARVSGASFDKFKADSQIGPSCSDGGDGVDGEEELVLSEDEAEQLGSVMSCLSSLATSARGVEEKGLAPFNVAPLLKRIDQIVSLYEDCGDAQTEEDYDDMSGIESEYLREDVAST